MQPLGLAQPFAADGGWARPFAVPAQQSLPGVGVAMTATGTTVVWADQRGVWSTSVGPAGAAPRTAAVAGLLAEATNVRGLSAGTVDGRLAVAWAERDRNTGQYHHRAWWRGEVMELFTDPLDVSFEFVDLGGRPYAAATLRRRGEAQLTLLPLDGGTPVVVHHTPLSVRGVTYSSSSEGLWLSWLEGKTERTEFGLSAEWNAYAALLAGPDSVAAPLDLGSADVSDERQRAVICAAPDGAAVLWTDDEGGLRLVQLAEPAAEGGAPRLGRVSVAAFGSGRPLAAAWPYVYWTAATTFRRLDAGELLATGSAQPTNILWSPVTVEGAAFGHAGDLDEPGLDALAWYGRVAGGSVEIYFSDDGAPMRRNLADRLAKAMDWNPWFIWEQAIGQALTALLIGVLGVLVALPYLLIVTPLTARRRRGRPGGQSAGLVIGALPVLAVSVGLAAAGVYGHVAPLASAGTVLLALVLGTAGAYLVTRKGDREPQATALLAGAFAVFGSMAVWSFITYPDWAPLVGLA